MIRFNYIPIEFKILKTKNKISFYFSFKFK